MSRRHREFRQALLKRLGVSESQAYSCYQSHSQKTLMLSGRPPAHYASQRADGLLTRIDNAVLTVTVADCLPIFIVDKYGDGFGLLHSGWRGTGIIESAIATMGTAYDCTPASLKVVIGPGIGSCCYQVDRHRYQQFQRRFGPQSGRQQGDYFYLDLRGANIKILNTMGIDDITVIQDCTFCNPHLASFRREAVRRNGPETTEHMLAFIGRVSSFRRA